MRRALVELVGWLAMACCAGVAQTGGSPAEKALFDMANQFRTQNGVAPLAWNDALAKAARVHAQRMVKEPGELEHQYSGEPDVVARAAQAGAQFGAVAENLARRGQTPEQLQQKWESTPEHRTNLLDPKMTAVGIGVVESGGLLYAVEDFARTVAAPKREEIEKQVIDGMRKAEMQDVKMSEAARSNCEEQGSTSPGALLVVHWEGSDPGTLPDALLEQLRSGKYHSAAVGACPSQGGGQGFTTYRVAVLLF